MENNTKHPLEQKFIDPRQQAFQKLFDQARGLTTHPGYPNHYDVLFQTGLRMSKLGASHEDAERVFYEICDKSLNKIFRPTKHCLGFYFAGYYSDPFWKDRMFRRFKHLDGSQQPY